MWIGEAEKASLDHILWRLCYMENTERAVIRKELEIKDHSSSISLGGQESKSL